MPRCGPQNLYGEQSRTSQPIARDVDALVGGVVDGVDPRDRARLAGEAADPPRVGERAGRVRREREGDDARPLGELALEVVVVDRELVGRVDDAHRQALVGGELDPRRDAAVVVERRREDLVARRRSRGRPRG